MSFREDLGDIATTVRRRAKRSSFWTKWFWFILAVTMALALITFLVIESITVSNKAVKALHTKDTLLKKKELSTIDAEIATKEREKQRHLKRAKKYLAKADKKEKRVTELQKRAKNNDKILDSLENWNDAEKRVKY